MKQVGSVPGGVDTVLDAILEVIGSRGTFMVYADWEVTPQCPAFDAQNSPCATDHGIFAEAVRMRARSMRSSNPGASVAAIGPAAAFLVTPHSVNYGYGRGTPFERFCQRGGRILLLGRLFDKVTLLHYAESVAKLPRKRVRRYMVPVRCGKALTQVQVEEFETSVPIVEGMPENYFEIILEEYVLKHAIRAAPVGDAESYLLEGADLVRFAVRKMEQEYGSGLS